MVLTDADYLKVKIVHTALCTEKVIFKMFLKIIQQIHEYILIIKDSNDKKLSQQNADGLHHTQLLCFPEVTRVDNLVCILLISFLRKDKHI